MENASKTADEIIERMERALRGDTWTSKDGRKKRIIDMDDGHLANTILMLLRGFDANGKVVPEKLKEKLRLLQEEWKFRHGDKPVASDRMYRERSSRRVKKVVKGQDDGKAKTP